MKTLFIYQYTYSKTGGIQSFNKTFLEALEAICENENIKNEFLGIYDKTSDVKSNLNGSCFQGNKVKAFFFLLSKIYYYDIFIISHVNLALIGIFVKILNPKAKLIFCTHGIEVWQDLPWFTKKIMNKSRVLTVSSFSKDMLIKFNSKLKSIVVFPNAIKVKSDIIYEKPVDKKKSFNLLTVCRLDRSERSKGVDSTIKALALIKDKISFTYYVIGKGDDVVRLKQLVKDKGIEDKVCFLGFVKDLNDYYNVSDVFIMPSKKEGFGIVYLEAMLYKKAVIACNYGGVKDVVIDKETGLLTNYDNIVEISNAIVYMYKNKSKALVYGENGYNRLLANFTYDHFKDRLKKELLNL